MTRPSPLDDPATARIAWARYRRLMGWMALATAATVIAGLTILTLVAGDNLSIHMVIATGLGIAGSLLLTALLMGLVFLSSGTGHDESIDDPFEDLRDS